MNEVMCPYLVKDFAEILSLNVFLSLLCLSAGSSDGAVQELAHGRHRDERGKTQTL